MKSYEQPSEDSQSNSVLDLEDARDWRKYGVTDIKVNKVENREFIIYLGEETGYVASVDIEINGDNGKINFIVVDYEYRGKGIGRELVRSIESRMKSKGVDIVILPEIYENSKAFWSRNGYVPQEEGSRYNWTKKLQ